MARLLIAVGCNQYEHLSQLYGAEEDANSAYGILTGNGSGYNQTESKLLLSPSVNELRATLDENLFGQQPIEVLTIFFAGHGGVKSGTYYLCLKDTHPERLSTTGLGLVQLFTIINECNPQQVNIIIDACESGGSMLDISIFSKPEVIGKVNSLSVSLLAACSPNQYAYEDPESQAGVATSELLKYLRGDVMLQNTRPFLDLVELGRAVSTAVSQKRPDQTPITWGLNLYGQGQFAKNPHYIGQEFEFPLGIVAIPPNSSIGKKIQHYSERLWTEYRQITHAESYRRLVTLLNQVCSDLESDGESCLPFIKGVATSFRVRAAASSDLLAESDILSCCATVLLSRVHSEEVKSYIRELLTERTQTDGLAIKALQTTLQENKYALINPLDASSDFYYLPIRVSKTLGWLGTTIIISELLGQEIGNIRSEIRQLSETILDLYGKSLVAITDEQAPYIYLFSKACQICEWGDLAQKLLQKYYENVTSTSGAIAAIGLGPEDAFNYTFLRAIGVAPKAYKLLATPSQFISSLLLCGASFSLASDWNRRLAMLDHKSLSFYLPTDYSAFGDEWIENGDNFTYHIGHGIWTLEDVVREFESSCKPKIVSNDTIKLAETKAACILSSYLFPDRIPYFLEVDF